MNPAEIAFAGLVATVLFGAGAAVFLKNVYHNALGLGLALFGIAGLYIFLGAEFLAVMQVIIYVGAISVAILFAIMLSRPLSLPRESTPRPRLARAAVAATGLFTVTCAILLSAPWPVSAAVGDVPLETIGGRFLRNDVFAFEAVSVLLLVAIIGSIAVSRREDRP